jgi:ppGpp synthetase/RelA/SpoT-type nucleotidyltranferase
MDQTKANDILTEYDSRLPQLSSFTTKLKLLLEEILLARGFRVHSVSGRTKKRPDLSKKLLRPDSNYNNLNEVTDIVGSRIITYFSDEVDIVAKIIEEEFLVDIVNTVDKRALLDPDRFGYLSLHYIVQLKPERAQLPEYQRFSNVKAEIQIRSILQHAWAEIEHDLGYKSNLSVPREERRIFSQLAGLLEIADQQFVDVRTRLEDYMDELPAQIRSGSDEILLDQVSLSTFVHESTVLRDLDQDIATSINATLENIESPQIIDTDILYFGLLGVNRITQLEKLLSDNHNTIRDFAAIWLKSGNYPSLMRSISFLYLFYVLLAKYEDEQRILDIINKTNLGRTEDKPALVKRILETYSLLKTRGLTSGSS